MPNPPSPNYRQEVLICVAFPPDDPRAKDMNGKRREAHITRIAEPDNDLAADEVDVGVLAKVNMSEKGLAPKYERHLVGGFTKAKYATTADERTQHGRWWYATEEEV